MHKPPERSGSGGFYVLDPQSSGVSFRVDDANASINRENISEPFRHSESLRGIPGAGQGKGLAGTQNAPATRYGRLAIPRHVAARSGGLLKLLMHQAAKLGVHMRTDLPRHVVILFRRAT